MYIHTKLTLLSVKNKPTYSRCHKQFEFCFAWAISEQCMHTINIQCKYERSEVVDCYSVSFCTLLHFKVFSKSEILLTSLVLAECIVHQIFIMNWPCLTAEFQPIKMFKINILFTLIIKQSNEVHITGQLLKMCMEHPSCMAYSIHMNIHPMCTYLIFYFLRNPKHV